MRIAKDDIPTKIDVPGAVARQATGFGDVSGYTSLSAEYFSLGAGTDIAPLLETEAVEDLLMVPEPEPSADAVHLADVDAAVTFAAEMSIDHAAAEEHE